MTTTSNTQPTNDKPSSQPLFEAFPEPQAWPKNWDVTALEALARPKAKQPKSDKPQA